MNIALLGIYGLYNFGCEAIVRGCVEFFKEFYPDANYTYYSYRAEEDKKKLDNLNIKVEQLDTYKSFTSRVVNHLAFKCKVNRRISLDYPDKIIENSDIIVSIGGDIYTVPEYMRDNPDSNYYNPLIQFGEKVIKKRKLLIIYGASIGPFGNIEKIQKYYFDHLRKVPLIICREKITEQYLLKNGVKSNVVFMPDPAFLIRLGNGEYNKNSNIIGINLSGLSNYEVYGNQANMHNPLVNVIEEIIEKTGMEIRFIPHVISPISEHDNDLKYVTDLFQQLSTRAQERISISSANSFFEAKKELVQCKVVIAARMHCAINALSENIPTILIAYSSKAIGMARYIYNNDIWAIDIKDTKTSLCHLLEQLLADSSNIKLSLLKRMEEIDKDFENETELMKIREIIKNAI